MHVLIWLLVGGLLGWIAGLLMGRRDGVLLDVVIGIVGPLLSGWLIAPLVGTRTIDQGDFSIASLAVSLAGAVILLAIVNVGRRGRLR
jgi:uncharacterized membrane protein YeaQ/YmgE (transglycosylase-associated protein family)